MHHIEHNYQHCDGALSTRESLREAAKLLNSNQMSRLPFYDQHKTLSGIGAEDT